MTEFQNSGNSVVLNSFQPMQVENPNFELFWGHAPRTYIITLKSFGLGIEKMLSFYVNYRASSFFFFK